jgi:hypothetical protein
MDSPYLHAPSALPSLNAKQRGAIPLNQPLAGKTKIVEEEKQLVSYLH